MPLRSSAVRDTLLLLAVFGLLLGGLYAYTGTWPPAVIVESSSMMHKECSQGLEPPQCNPEVAYGRFGTIDPGDLVLVKSVGGPWDIETLVEGGTTRYGKSGDVVVFYPRDNRDRTPIIHRVVAYVVVEGPTHDRQYFVRWNADLPCEGNAIKQTRDAQAWCVYGNDGVYIPSVPVQRIGSSPSNPQPYKPEHTGFLTKGDNPSSNRLIDQVSGLSPTVKFEWVEGKGRGELPWLGLIKLALANRANEDSPPAEYVKIGSAYAPKDLWVMLGVSLFLLIGVPLIYDGAKAWRDRRVATDVEHVETDHDPGPVDEPLPAPERDDVEPDDPTEKRDS